ncbi:MAG: cardiolipin synthase [Lachnospiraceae bacterium]|nr:cardiolipin synthase [Lachnospiraceae bacterium]
MSNPKMKNLTRKIKKNGQYGKPLVSGILRALIVLLLVVVQVIFVVCLSLALAKYTVYFYFLIEILGFSVLMYLMDERNSSSYKIAWSAIILVLPVTGAIMFMLWGGRSRNSKEDKKVLAKMNNSYKYNKENKNDKESFNKEYPELKKLSNFLSKEKFPIYKNNNIEYYSMGDKAFRAMLEDIKKAKKFILLEFFIVAEGELWNNIHDLLLEKIKQGVEVKFLYDDFGTMFRTNKYFRYNLEQEGFEVRVFNPVHKYFDKLYFNYRTHQKIVVIDGNIGYTGGMNIADEYVNLKKRFGIWKDSAVRIEGEGVKGLTTTFLAMWDIAADGYSVDYNKYMPTADFKSNNSYCHIVCDGPANNPSNPIEDLYFNMIMESQDYLYITTPYLVIDDQMKKALVLTAKSGVDVRIITPHIPDKKTVKLLTEYNYGRLLKAGVKIYEYKPGFIHAKNIMSENCAVVGTINMDFRSFNLHYECGAWMCDKKIVNDIKQDFKKTLEECIEISYEEWKNRPIRVKIAQQLLKVIQVLF